MSQHIWTTLLDGRPVTLIMGWDRSLQGFFLDVTREDENDDADELLYSNLDDDLLASRSGMSHSLNYFVGVLTGLGITAPEAMLAAIRSDALTNAGNRIVTYDPEGRPDPTS